MWSLNLKNFWQNIKRRNFYFLFLLFLGFFLRAVNPTIGFPILHISNDEASAHTAALYMLENRTIISNAVYAPLGAYLQIPLIALSALVMFLDGSIGSFDDLKFTVLTHPGYFLFVPRLLSALFGTLLIIAIYKFSRALTGDRTSSFYASVLTATSFVFVDISTVGRAWPEAMFFYIMATLFCVYAIKSVVDRKKNVLLSFIFVAISYGFHQVGIFTFFLVLMLLFFSGTFKKIDKKLFFVSVIICLFLILIFSSLSKSSNLIFEIKQSNSFLRYNSSPAIRLLFHDYRVGVIDAFSETFRTSNFHKFFKYYLLLDPVIFVFSVLFIIRKKFNEIEIIILGFNVLYFIAWGLFFIPQFRYLLPVIIFGPVWAGAFLAGLSKKIRGRFLFLVVASVIFILSIFNSANLNLKLIKEPTYEDVETWVNKNVNPKTPIIFTKRRFADFVPSNEALVFTNFYNPNFYRGIKPYMEYDNYPDNVRNVLYLSEIPGSKEAEKLDFILLQYPAKYVIDYYWDLEERIYGMTKTNLELVKTISPSRDLFVNLIPLLSYEREILPYDFNILPRTTFDRPGPYFDILKVLDN